MGFTNFPNGVTSLGIPALGSGMMSIPSQYSREGGVWFVNGPQPGGGGTVDSPFETIEEALDAAGDGTGDTIFFYPGTYAETLTVTKAAISLLPAVQGGYNRPDIVPAAGVALTVSTGQGFVCQGMRFAGNTSDTAIVNANGYRFLDCVFDGDAGQSAAEGCLRLVPHATDDSYTASEGIIAGSYFRGSTSGAGVILQHGLATGAGTGVTDVQIVGNRFTANGADLLSAVNSTGGGTGIFTNTQISGNQFLTASAAYVYINFFAGAAGDLAANNALISGNWFNDDAFVIGQCLIASQPKTCFVGNFDAAGLINGSTFNN